MGTGIGNLGLGYAQLVETITLPITVGDWHCSRGRVICNVVYSITGSRQKTFTIAFYNDIQKYKFIHKIQFY